jgi:hypothetical protein
MCIEKKECDEVSRHLLLYGFLCQELAEPNLCLGLAYQDKTVPMFEYICLCVFAMYIKALT